MNPVLWQLFFQVGLWFLDKWFVRDPKNRGVFIEFVNTLRMRGLVDVKRRYQSEIASSVLEDRWNEIEKSEDPPPAEPNP